MADLPRIDNCPMNDKGICGCISQIHCSDVASVVCRAMRIAYCYGCTRTEAEMRLGLRDIKDKIDSVLGDDVEK